MNAVDQLLSDTADFLQAQIDADPALHAQLAALFRGGQQPIVVRGLNGFAGRVAVISLGEPPA